jgi:hypothetical protein
VLVDTAFHNFTDYTIENYLLDQKQMVAINDCCSDWRNVCASVPQSSILGPLFFPIYINDIVAEQSLMPNPIERFANVAIDYSNFLSVVKCLTEFVRYIYKLIDRRASVPQSSILGPLFFPIYINDIVADINSQNKVICR